MVTKLIKLLKENWIGGLIGGIIGITNIGSQYIKKVLPVFIQLIDCSPCPPVGICPPCPTPYTLLAIIILVLLGAFIQSLIKEVEK